MDDSAPVVSWVVKAIVAGSVFALMFKFIPLAPMRWRSVGFPALLTGTLFCAVQDLYVNSQLFLSSYNAIYGSFAILPLLMLWLYVTWSICLSGVALSCVIEQQTFLSSSDDAAPQLSRQADDVVALRMMGLLARRFLDGKPSLPLHHLARELQLPVDVAFRACRRLEAAGCLYRLPVEGETVGEAVRLRTVFKVDIDVHALTAGEVLRRFDAMGSSFSPTTSASAPPTGEAWAAALALRREWGRLCADDRPIAQV